MTKTALENKKLEATEKIEARKDKTAKRGQNLNLFGTAARAAGPIMGALNAIQDKSFFLNLNPVMSGSIADIPAYVNDGARMPTASGVNFITDYLVGATLFMPTVGNQASVLQESDINTGFFRLHALLKSMNSRFSATEAGDIGQLLYSELEICSMVASAKRALACAVYTDPNHIDLAKRLVDACGFDYDDLVTHWKDYSARLNILIDKINATIRVPADWALLKHRLAYNSCVHRDRNKADIAYHILVQHAFGKYDEDTASITYDDVLTIAPNNSNDMESYLYGIADLLNAFQNTSVINDFTSDMDNAATRGLKLYTIEYFDIHSPKVVFSDDPGIGDTIRNSLAYHTMAYYYSTPTVKANLIPSMFNIKQDSNGYLYQGILPNPDNVSASTIVMGWGTVNAWYDGSTGVTKPIIIPFNVFTASDFTGASISASLGRKYVSALDVDEVNADMGGILEAVRLQCKCSTVKLVTRLAASPSTVGEATLPFPTSMGTEFVMFHYWVPRHAQYHTNTGYVNVDWDIDTTWSAAAINGNRSYGYSPILSNATSSSIYSWDASVHKLVYLPEDNLHNILSLGTMSLFYIDAPLKLGGVK